MLVGHTFLVRERARVSAEGVEKRGAGQESEDPLPTLAEIRRRVVYEVARAPVSRAVLSRRKEERVGQRKAIARYWAGAG